MYLRAASSLSVMVAARAWLFFMAVNQNSGIPLIFASSGFSVLGTFASSSSSSSSSAPASISASVGSAWPLTIFDRFSYKGVNKAKYFFSNSKTSSWKAASSLVWSFWIPLRPLILRRTAVGRDSIYPDERPTRVLSLPWIIRTNWGLDARRAAASFFSASIVRACH